MWLQGFCTGGPSQCQHRGPAEFMTAAFALWCVIVHTDLLPDQIL